MVVDLKIHATGLDSETYDQIKRIATHPSVDGLVAIMPDAHAGAGCCIGTTLTFNNSICPNIVGVDIGCGMYAHEIGEVDIDFAKLDSERHRDAKAAGKVISHYSDRANCGSGLKDVINSAIEVQNRLNIRKNPVENQLGTLGGGNHFVEIGKDSAGSYWLIIHSGSRNFGLQVANYYQNKAKALTPVGSVPKGMEYLPMDQGGEDYLRDMKVAQAFARANREIMARMILRSLGVRYEDGESISSIHNYISETDGICRKGAIQAYKGQAGVIPLNMRDGTLKVTGKGNKDYNYSAPHGAGRVCSRGQLLTLKR